VLLADAAPDDLSAGDVIVVASKAVSKAEGRVVSLASVEPGERARALAAEQDKDPRVVQLILDESVELLRARRGVLITETRHGFVCANAGIDASNVPGDDRVVLLPEDPDASARALRAGLETARGVRPGVLVTDSFGRAWRLGQTDVAIGAAGVAVLDDWRGRRDHEGRELAATVLAAGDALAGAADLARSKDAGEPAVLVRGLERLVLPDDGPGAAALRRPRADDLFR
jgi:coenzyme F420-0:L-glutamate ligase / coenzyme F420-1:gamma-L-glutamate ligase